MPPTAAHDQSDADVRLVLVHSPIMSRDTWIPVAEVLRSRACQVVIPRVHSDLAPPFWAAHVDSIVESIGDPGPDPSPLVLVLHSGAGQLADHLVVALDRLDHTVEAVLFADAGVPTTGCSRLRQMERETPAAAAQLGAILDAGERFPGWTDAQIRSLVPDGARRRRLLDGVRTLPATYWREPIPMCEAPPHQCAVLLFSGSYAATAAAADTRNWPIIDLRADNHFLPVADEAAVADAILDLVDRLLVATL